MSLLYILHTVLHIGITTHNNIKNIDNRLSVICITSFLMVYVFVTHIIKRIIKQN